MDPGELRAADADRERVAQRLRTALDEGRLNLHEYDERLREAYGARTYTELDRLLVDLPGATASSQALTPVTPGSVPVWLPGSDGMYPGATRRWLADMWGQWGTAVAICGGIWVMTCLLASELLYFWPGWVAGPWGAVLLVHTVSGLSQGEPQRWAARRARKAAEQDVRRRARELEE